MSIDQIEHEILKLPRAVRAALAERLLKSLDESSEIESAWEEEADRRYQSYLAGEERAVPADDILAAIRERM